MYGNSAAHKRLPLGTLVQVRNLENGKRIVVPVNDRGPFIPGRIIDLSYGAAMALGIVGPGTAYVEIRAVGDAPPPEAPELMLAASQETDGYRVQVGAFADRENAKKLATALNRTYRGIRVSADLHPSASRKMYRVVVGEGGSFQTARQWVERLRADGYEDVFMVPE
jgi:rare lipoprotein A